MNATRIIAVIALGFAGAGLVAPTALADPPPWAPAHGWRAKHQYVYYPAGRVYYEPVSRMWFWLGGNGWRTGVSLPAALRGYVRVGGVKVFLDVDRPYLRDDYVVYRYGGHHRWRDRDDDRDHYRYGYYRGHGDDDHGYRGHRRHEHDDD